MGEVIDLMLEAAGYLDACHDDEADNLRRKLRDKAEALFIARELAEPIPDGLPFVEGGEPYSRPSSGMLDSAWDKSVVLAHELSGEA